MSEGKEEKKDTPRYLLLVDAIRGLAKATKEYLRRDTNRRGVASLRSGDPPVGIVILLAGYWQRWHHANGAWLIHEWRQRLKSELTEQGYNDFLVALGSDYITRGLIPESYRSILNANVRAHGVEAAVLQAIDYAENLRDPVRAKRKLAADMAHVRDAAKRYSDYERSKRKTAVLAEAKRKVVSLGMRMRLIKLRKMYPHDDPRYTHLYPAPGAMTAAQHQQAIYGNLRGVHLRHKRELVQAVRNVGAESLTEHAKALQDLIDLNAPLPPLPFDPTIRLEGQDEDGWWLHDKDEL